MRQTSRPCSYAYGEHSTLLLELRTIEPCDAVSPWTPSPDLLLDPVTVDRLIHHDQNLARTVLLKWGVRFAPQTLRRHDAQSEFLHGLVERLKRRHYIYKVHGRAQVVCSKTSAIRFGAWRSFAVVPIVLQNDIDVFPSQTRSCRVGNGLLAASGCVQRRQSPRFLSCLPAKRKPAKAETARV